MTEDEALDNIRIAIEEYVGAVEELTRGQQVREIEVAV
jgi:predicted RNase H-like HicB family nuclease